MIKKVMVVFFGAFAALIVLSVVMLSGKMVLLQSPDGKTVYELRLHDGRMQHALRHGGVQIFSWSDIALEDGNGRNFSPKSLGVKRNNAKTGEFEIEGFPENVRLLVRVTDTFVASAFYDLPAGTTVERVDIRPEAGAYGAQFSEESVAGTPDGLLGRPFIFIAPKADGGDTYLVYQHTESGDSLRPRYLYSQEDLALCNFNAKTVYHENSKDGWLHVLYFSDSPVLLREIYEAGVPAAPFPTLREPRAEDSSAD